MDNKAIIAIIAVAVIVVAGVAIAVAINNNNNKGGDSPEPVPPKDFTPEEIMSGATLKVMGNANKDTVIDKKDVDAIKKMIADKTNYNDCPIADANNDKVIDDADVAVVEAIIAGDNTTVNHINYWDSDDDGIMEMHLVSTAFPVKSCIISGSANTGMTLILLGVTDRVVGAAYSATSLDKTLYKTTLLDTAKVEKIGTSASTIPFEDGKIGTSDIIKEKNVTALITDWNRSYIKNWEDFENAKVDVVRGASASSNNEVSENTFRTYGLLFQADQSRINSLVELYSSTMTKIKTIAASIADADKVKAVACSSTGSVSSKISDYTELIRLVGGIFGLEDYDAAGSSSVKVVDHPEIFSYDFDYVLHLRTNPGYELKTAEQLHTLMEEYGEVFTTWDEFEGHSQYIISAATPIPVRAAMVGCVLYPELYDADWVDQVHKEFAKFFPADVGIDIDDRVFIYTEEPIDA